MTDLITRYLALPAGTKMAQAAELLGVGLSTLEKAKKAAGVTRPIAQGSNINPVEDRRIVAAYLALTPGMGMVAAASVLGIGGGRLTGALERTGTRRTVAVVAERVQEAPRTARRGPDALPAGSPESWDVLGFGPWPFGTGVGR